MKWCELKPGHRGLRQEEKKKAKEKGRHHYMKTLKKILLHF